MSDLLDISSISKSNDGYKFILVCIDVLSKYAWAVPIRNKSGLSVRAAIKHIIESSNRKCINFQTDKGSEYLNSSVKEYLRKMKINHFTSENDDLKAMIAERFIRTLKDRIWRYFTYKRTKRFIDQLPNFIDSYNNTIHSTIKMTPSSVSKEDEFILLHQMHDTQINKRTPKYAVGDTVRISMTKVPFKKGYNAQWTEEIFKIISLEHTSPITYRLSDLQGDPIKGRFYTQEIQRIRIRADKIYRIERVIKTRRKNNKTEQYVKWFGFPEKFNSWVQKKDVLH